RNLARMAVSAGRAEPVFAGETAQFRLYLEARAGFDRPSILVRHVRSRAQMVLDVPAAGLAEVVLGVPAERRGWLPLGRVMLETRFPLGIFRAWSYIEPEARCLIYPRPQRSPLPAPSAESAKGTLRSPTPGNDDYAGLRAYQLSDSPRHVAWKAVARSDDMLTKQFTGEAAAELWLDWARLAVSLGIVITPHALRAPWWLALLTLCLYGWRFYCTLNRSPLPARWLAVGVALVGMLGVWVEYRTLFGRQPGVLLLMFFSGLKLLE